MPEPLASDWGFDNIRAADGKRAGHLEHASPSSALVAATADALTTAIKRRDVRIGVDSKDNLFKACRTIVQFPVDRDLYDWFFNARTGYRAQFWSSTGDGIAFNAAISSALAAQFLDRLSFPVPARKIVTIKTNGAREDRDAGSIALDHDLASKSLGCAVAKVWICERLMSAEGVITNIFAPVLAAAAREGKLIIPRWVEGAGNHCTGEGLLAPYPDPEYAWLDLKGSFIAGDGSADQIKPDSVRAKALHECGWT